MSYTKLLFFISLIVLVLLPFQIYSQQLEVEESDKKELKMAAREIIEASQTCTLITIDNNAIPMVRIMDPFAPEEDFTIWFGTNAKSRKVKQIKQNPNVTLYYQDSDSSGYVVIHGIAQLVDDAKEKQTRWKEAWEDFYPNDRENYLLIKVSPQWMEILSVSRGILGDESTWKTPVLRFD